MDYYEDFYDVIIRDIKKACPDALADLGLSWRSDVSFPMLNVLTGGHEWQIDFHEHGKLRCCVRFSRPPHADVQWYKDEIIRQISARAGCYLTKILDRDFL